MSPAGGLWRTWWRLLPSLWPPLLVAYLANALLLALRHWPPGAADTTAGRAGELLEAGLLLVASWFGQAWAAAAVGLLTECGSPAPTAVWRQVRNGVGRLVPVVAVRCAVVYGPLFLLALVASRPPTGGLNLVPVAVLLLVPLSANLAAVFGPLAAVVMHEPPASTAAVVVATRLRGEAHFWRVLLGGGALLVLIGLTSFLPGPQPRLFPNHVVGSVLWVLLALSWTAPDA